MIETLLTKPARLKYVLNRGEDQYGQPIVQTEYRDTKCYYRLMNTALGDAVSVSEMEMKVHLPATTAVDGLQGVSVDGVEYQPSGLVHRQWNPRRQKVEYLTLKVKRAT